MAKRRLSRQQAGRIRRRQRASAEKALRGGGCGADTTAVTDGDGRQGLVTAHFGNQVEIEDQEGRKLRCHQRANLEELVAGDRAVWSDLESGDPVITARLTRKNALLRPDPYGEPRAVAANVDRIIVVIAPQPEPVPALLDRYLVAAEYVDIEPVILLNKCDLLGGNTELEGRFNALLEIYSALGYAVLRTSAVEQSPDTLKEALRGHTSVFVGQSGVGKSSLVNRLLPAAEQRTAPLSETAARGTHTTTTARLFHLPGGGSLIDSPGIREFGLWHLRRGDIEAGFRELNALRGDCRYRDCRHAGEPGCAVQEALRDGRIHPSRMASFQHLVAAEAPD